jgi:DNA-binding NarL/FixJ family response regulator
LNRSQVLLADDDQAMLEAEIALLAPYFDVVGTAADGAALMSKTLSLHPDVIVTDITMPILNGIEALRRLRESGSNATFVFLTVHAEEVFVEECMKAGALGYVQKSCMKRHLVPAVQAASAGQTYVSLFNPSRPRNDAE